MDRKMNIGVFFDGIWSSYRFMETTEHTSR